MASVATATRRSATAIVRAVLCDGNRRNMRSMLLRICFNVLNCLVSYPVIVLLDLLQRHLHHLFHRQSRVVRKQGGHYLVFGFASKQERELYRQLITVSGVGGNTARMILSSLSPSELCNVISSGNDKMLKGVKGIGLKTAQRIILDLRDKIVSLGIADELPANGGNVVMVNNDVKDEAVSALTMLGFSPAPSAKVVVDILKAQPDLPVEQVVKLALKQIK